MSKEVSEILRKIDLGIKKAVANALAEHKRAGRDIVIYANGKIRKIPPEKIVIDKK